MILAEKKKAFLELSRFLKQFSHFPFQKDTAVLANDLFYDAFSQAVQSCVHYNGWFTLEQVITSISSWSRALNSRDLDQWTAAYNLDREPLQAVGLILAGNIPLVGFHDFLCVLVSGNRVVVKPSSNDQKLLPLLADYLVAVEPQFDDRIVFVENRLTDFDAVIATGSNNSARYFDYYFSQVPNIIRKNRNSIAVLDGSESAEELNLLGQDILTYFGLGCRNVSKLFVPKNYNFDAFFQAMFAYQDIVKLEKYANNYDYNKAVFLMSNFKILDNGFMTLKEDQSYSSPISSVFFEYYDTLDELNRKLQQDSDRLQCIVSNNLVAQSTAFGSTQSPKLWDYADGIDSLEFLLNLK